MTSTSGAPLKPWELARMGQSQNTISESLAKKEEAEENTAKSGATQMAQPTPSYAPYAPRSYATPYQPHHPYGNSSYYGYPSSYGTGLYGTSYGTSYGTHYGGMYGYSRPSPWSQQPYIPGMMPQSGGAPPAKMPMWQRFLDGLHKLVNCFGRVTCLVDENTQAFHFFITALLTFLDKAGSLYGEIARFVLKLLGLGRRSRRDVSKASVSPKIEQTEIFQSVWNK